MTFKQFWVDPYQTKHGAMVRTAASNEVTLDSTIFFAFSGGQESDHGTFNGIPVISARKEGLDIIYTLPEEAMLCVGEQVEIEIDWARRHRLMQLHFAAELVLEIMYKMLPDAEKVGAHIGQDKARIDFGWPQSIAPLLEDVAAKANEIISADLAIVSEFEERETERRYWEIEGFSRVPCGGTHVRSTGEIGRIRLKRENKGRGKERVEIYLAA